MQDDSKLHNQIRTALNDSVDKLETDVSRRLQQARHAALAKVEKPRLPFWQTAGTFALASILLLAILLLPDRQNAPKIAALADLEFIETDNLQLYKELDFYQWLLENDTNAS